jgi:hypothetical protein
MSDVLIRKENKDSRYLIDKVIEPCVKALENFGFYVPDEEMLPVLLFEATNLGVYLISYFRHPDGFSKENMVSDRNTEECEVSDGVTIVSRKQI